MKFNEIMHLSFFTDQMELMRDFYENKLGLKAKVIMRYEAYKGTKNRGYWSDRAITNPNDIAYIFIELAPGQFLEIFPRGENQLEHEKPDTRLGYSHFALMVDDIHEARKELERSGVMVDIEPNKGQSEAWQMWIHDPDGNKFEIMQFTENSLILKGNIEEDNLRYNSKI